MTETDAELHRLVPAAVAGDAGALRGILRLIHPLVLRYARARISGGRAPTAEDVAQETCLAVATSITRYRDRGRPFMAFVYGIAFNKVADAHRSMARDHSVPTDELPERQPWGERHTGPATAVGLGPEGAAVARDGSNRARRLLDSLGDKARDIVILRVIVGLSADETAAIVGSTPGAVRVAQHRALHKLRTVLEQGEDHD